jgi:hypothetical protein
MEHLAKKADTGFSQEMLPCRKASTSFLLPGEPAMTQVDPGGSAEAPSGLRGVVK